MKVLHIGSNSVHIFRFIEAFKKEDVQHYFLSDESGDNTIINVQKSYTLDFHSINPFVIYKNLKKLKQLLSDVQPNIVHIHQVTRMAFWVSKVIAKQNIPSVLTAWGSDVLVMPYKNFIYKYLVKNTLKNASEITADATVMIDSMNKLVPNLKYHLVQYGIEPIIALEKEKIIYSNRLHEPLYRIDEIVNMFHDFLKNHRGWQLKIAGLGSETEQLKEKVKKLDIEKNVQFLGWLNNEENRKNYQTAMIYVSIPKSDGTSVSLMESMSAGCIPVVSNLPANRQWIEHKKNGIVVSETNQQNGLELALTLNQPLLALSNHTLILSNASRTACVEKFYQLYKNHC
jgi:glycosyltransferase involved in cell wall biosynthesis